MSYFISLFYINVKKAGHTSFYSTVFTINKSLTFASINS